MASTDGVQSQIDFATPVGDPAKVQAMIDAIPDPDTTSTSGAQQGIAGFLDEMSPIAATQLRVELTALKAAVS